MHPHPHHVGFGGGAGDMMMGGGSPVVLVNKLNEQVSIREGEDGQDGQYGNRRKKGMEGFLIVDEGKGRVSVMNDV